MRTRPELSLVIPAYNEETRIEPPLREAVDYLRARAYAAEILVVDDGSRDRTSEVVSRLSWEFDEIRLIRLAANRGKGYAVRTGIVNARGRYVLFADADGSTPIRELERLRAAMDRGAAVAIGSRALHSEGVEVRARAHRKLIGRAFHLLVELLAVKRISDTQCGFKLFRHDVAHDLFSRMRMDGFSFDVEVLMMAQTRGYPIEEVAVNWEHRSGSQVSLVKDSARMAFDLFVIRLHAIRGKYAMPHVARLAYASGAPVGREASVGGADWSPNPG